MRHSREFKTLQIEMFDMIGSVPQREFCKEKGIAFNALRRVLYGAKVNFATLNAVMKALYGEREKRVDATIRYEELILNGQSDGE